MNEMQAWNSFARSGRIEDYLRYARLRGSLDRGDEGVSPKEGFLCGSEIQDPGAYPSGDDPGGERPGGDSSHRV